MGVILSACIVCQASVGDACPCLQSGGLDLPYHSACRHWQCCLLMLLTMLDCLSLTVPMWHGITTQASYEYFSGMKANNALCIPNS